MIVVGSMCSFSLQMVERVGLIDSGRLYLDVHFLDLDVHFL